MEIVTWKVQWIPSSKVDSILNIALLNHVIRPVCFENCQTLFNIFGGIGANKTVTAFLIQNSKQFSSAV